MGARHPALYAVLLAGALVLAGAPAVTAAPAASAASPATIRPAAAVSHAASDRGPAAERVAEVEQLAGQRLIVRWQPQSSERARGAVLRSLGATLVHDLGSAVVIQLDTPRAAGRAAAALVGDPHVLAVEPDRVVRAASTSDPGYAQQWGIENTGQEVQSSHGRAGIDARATGAWERTVGAPDVVVAIVDSGVDVGHPDLADNIWRNPHEEANGADDDGNGLVDDIDGWDFKHDDGTVYDDAEGDSHGTEIAGVIAAVADNGLGVTGIAPQVSVLPVKFLESGIGAMSDGLAGLRYAAAEGADVIVASWIGERDAPLLRDVIAETRVLVVAPAGNDGRDLSLGATSYPASYTLPNLISVAAIDNQGFLAGFSNRGSRQIDLAAPGVAVLTTTTTVPPATETGYAYVSGTSMAAAFTAGAAALAVAVDPRLPAAELADLVRRSSRAYLRAAGTTISGGILDARALVEMTAAESVPGACFDPPPSSFEDVSRRSIHISAIDCLVLRGGAEGRSETEYAPQGYVTRAAMATFLFRVVTAAGIEVEDPPDAFGDDDGSVHEPSIDAVAALGIVEGVEPGVYAPAEVVTRAQMATMLRRTHTAVLGTSRSPSRQWFDDTSAPHEYAINVVRDLGIAAGTVPREFDPSTGVRRDQMATFLVALLDVLVRADAVEGR